MVKLKSFFGALIIVLLSGFVLFLWFKAAPFSIRFQTSQEKLTSLGQITGLLGMTLFGINLILSARLRFLEDFFSGLNRIYINHHRLGGYAFCLLLFHPLFLAGKYIYISSYQAAIFLLPSRTDLPKTLGIYSLIIMLALLVATFYMVLKYQTWKFSHKFLGIAYLLGFLHMILIPSDVSRYFALKLFLIVLSVFAVAAYFYRTVLNELFVKKYMYEVVKLDNIGGLFEITLLPKTKKMPYSPGQFCFFKFICEGVRAESHPFSIIPSQDSREIKLVVKNLGDFTCTLDKLKHGAEAEIEGPFGRFFADNSARRQIWIAGGIGITPFMSMLKSIVNQKVDLYWSVKNEDEAVYLNLLKSYANSKNARIIPFYSDKQGFLTADFIAKTSEDYLKSEIYLCGPPVMMKALRSQLVQTGIRNYKIHSEEFSL